MKKNKTILAFALAISMCVSLAACGNSDEGEKDDAEEKVTTTAADEESEETDGANESKAEAEESSTDSEGESKADESADSESEPVVLTHDIDLKEFIDVTIVENCLGHDVDTVGNALSNALEISEKVEANEWGSYTLNFPDDLTFDGIHFNSLYLYPDSYDNDNINSFNFCADCDPEKTLTPEETGMTYYNPLRSEINDIIQKAGFEESDYAFGGEYYLRDPSGTLFAFLLVEQNYTRDKDSGMEIPSYVSVTIDKY